MKKRYLEFVEKKVFLYASIGFMSIYSLIYNLTAKTSPKVSGFFLIIFAIMMIIVLIAPIERLIFNKQPIKYQLVFSGTVICVLLYVIIDQLLTICS